MITCPLCGSTDITIVEEHGYATVDGHAEADAACECIDCECAFDVHASGDFIINESDYAYDITHYPDEEF